MLRVPKSKLAHIRWRILFGVLLASVTATVIVVLKPADAARFSYRGMYINSAVGGEATHYIISLEYPTASPLGSLRMEFCDNPIPSLPCNAPAGMDVGSGTLTTQSGSTTGFSVATQTPNLIILGRSSSLPGTGVSSYRFDNMVNPSDEHQDFYVRITSHSSMDGTGPIIDFGSVTSTTTPEQSIYTQVPPVITFCVAEQINDNECLDTVGNYVDFGELDPSQTYTASSEVLVYTNAQYGLSISLAGKTMTSGIKEIPALSVPGQSFVGVSQFGLNAVLNSSPAVGASPAGPGSNLVYNPNYTTPDWFLFNPGDVLATSSEVTQTQKFTVSYVLNVSEDQDPGVYSTTITYICLAGF